VAKKECPEFQFSGHHLQRQSPLSTAGQGAFLLITNRSLNFSGQFWRDCIEAMRFLGVLRARPQDVLNGFSARLEITIHSDISATNDFSHVFCPPLS
jgi:hypothetical protein